MDHTRLLFGGPRGLMFSKAALSCLILRCSYFLSSLFLIHVETRWIVQLKRATLTWDTSCRPSASTEPSSTFLQKSRSTEQCTSSPEWETMVSCFWHGWTGSHGSELVFKNVASEGDDTATEFFTCYSWISFALFYHCLYLHCCRYVWSDRCSTERDLIY